MTANANIAPPEIPELDSSLFVEVDLFGQEMKANPIPRFLEWAKKSPFYVMVNGRPNAVICRHDQVKWAFTDYETISGVPQPGWGVDMFDYFNGLPILTEFNPPEHTALRRLIQPGFTPRRVAQYQDVIDGMVDEMIEGVAAKGSFDMISDFAAPFMYRLLLGGVLELPQEHWPIFTRFNDVLELVATVPQGAAKPKEYMDAYNAAYEYCSNVIEQRRNSPPKDDLVGGIIDAHDVKGELSTEDLFSILMQLFTAGLGTVIATLGLCSLRLCRHPDQLKLLQQDPSLINGAIEECLRVDSLGNYRHRFVMKDCEVDGTPLYRGMVVHISMGASNYDPDFYPDPEKFDITRNPKDISTFGHATHFCAGNALARTVLRKVIGKMVARFPRLRLMDPDAVVEYGGMPTERFPLSVRLSVD
ncbi:MAG: cytochrome P450 [Spongiibacteraceae bacterium]